MEYNNNNYNNYNNNNYEYNPYNNAYYHTENESHKKRGAFEGFGVTLVKTVAIALVFGLVTGATTTAVLHFSGNTLGLFGGSQPSVSIPERDEEESEEVKGDEPAKEDSLQQTDTVVTVNTAMDVSDIVDKAMPCVVAISNTSEVTYQNIWGQTYTQEGQSAGTGFIVRQDKEYIYIATNNHVIADATKLEVQFCDSVVVEATVKGTVASKDVAVIKVAVEDIPRETQGAIRLATLGDSNALEVGEASIAIGNALGYGQSVTTGVISATGRSVTVQDSSTGEYVVNNNLIQTDAAINPGNSGGALLNIKGEVIGINSVKYADTDVEGIGYAIPINDAMLIIDKLIEDEKIDESQSGYLGIQGQNSELGAYVVNVLDNSAAEAAGILAGDIIIQFEGYEIATMNQLKELLSYYAAGEEVSFVILRPSGDTYAEVEIHVTLGDASTIQQ